MKKFFASSIALIIAMLLTSLAAYAQGPRPVPSDALTYLGASVSQRQEVSKNNGDFYNILNAAFEADDQLNRQRAQLLSVPTESRDEAAIGHIDSQLQDLWVGVDRAYDQAVRANGEIFMKSPTQRSKLQQIEGAAQILNVVFDAMYNFLVFPPDYTAPSSYLRAAARDRSVVKPRLINDNFIERNTVRYIQHLIQQLTRDAFDKHK